MKRGDIVVCNLSGDYGKPRPALVVQSDLFNPTHASITICPITSEIIDAPLFRISIQKNKINGLLSHSQIMVDKITSIKKEKIKNIIGKVTNHEMDDVDQKIKRWLDLV